MRFILQEVLEFIVDLLQTLCEGVLFKGLEIVFGESIQVNTYYTDEFRPNLNYFKTTLLGFSTSNGVSPYDTIVTAISRFSLILLATIIAVSVLIRLFSSVQEFKTDIPTMIMRIAFSIFIIRFAPSVIEMLIGNGTIWAVRISDYSNNVGELLYSLTLKPFESFGNANGQILTAGRLGTHLLDSLSIRNIFDGYDSIVDIFALPNLGPDLIGSVVETILIVAITVEMMKMTIEIIQHYITLCSLSLFSPLSGAFFFGEESSKAFYSYWKMILTEMGLLVINRVWATISILVYITMVTHASNLSSAIAFLALLRVGSSLNGIARSMGLTTSGMMGSLGQSLIASGAAVVFALSRGAGTASKALVGVGSATGKTGFVRAGNMIAGRGASSEAVSQAMAGSMLGRMAENSAKKSGKSNYTASIGREMANLMGKGTFSANSQLAEMFSHLNAAGKAEALAALGKDKAFSGIQGMFKLNGKSVALTGMDGKGNFTFDVLKGGNPTGEKGTIGLFDSTGKSIAVENGDGVRRYFATNGSPADMANKPFELPKVLNGTSDAEIAGINVPKLCGGLYENGKLKEGIDDNYRIMQKDGQAVLQHKGEAGFDAWASRGNVTTDMNTLSTGLGSGNTINFGTRDGKRMMNMTATTSLHDNGNGTYDLMGRNIQANIPISTEVGAGLSAVLSDGQSMAGISIDAGKFIHTDNAGNRTNLGDCPASLQEVANNMGISNDLKDWTYHSVGIGRAGDTLDSISYSPNAGINEPAVRALKDIGINEGDNLAGLSINESGMLCRGEEEICKASTSLSALAQFYGCNDDLSNLSYETHAGRTGATISFASAEANLGTYDTDSLSSTYGLSGYGYGEEREMRFERSVGGDIQMQTSEHFGEDWTNVGTAYDDKYNHVEFAGTMWSDMRSSNDQMVSMGYFEEGVTRLDPTSAMKSMFYGQGETFIDGNGISHVMREDGPLASSGLKLIDISPTDASYSAFTASCKDLDGELKQVRIINPVSCPASNVFEKSGGKTYDCGSQYGTWRVYEYQTPKRKDENGNYYTVDRSGDGDVKDQQRRRNADAKRGKAFATEQWNRENKK